MKKANSLSDLPALAPLDGLSPDAPSYDIRLHSALSWLHQHLDNRTLRTEALAYLNPALQSLADPPPLSRLEDWRFTTLGKLAYLMNRGFRPSERTGRWLLTKFHTLVHEAANAPEPEPVVRAAAVPLDDPADDLLADIVSLVDSGGLADQPDRPFALLTAGEIKLAGAKKILAGLEKRCEAVDKRRKKDCGSAIQQVRNYLENLAATRKPRRVASKPTDKLVAGLEYLKEHGPLQVTSINPEQIIGAKGLLVLNSKTRKIGLYVAAKGGLSVKGKSIENYDEKKSVQKTLRKPDEQVPDLRNAVGIKAVTDVLTAIATTPIPLSGRINADTLLVKAIR